MRKSVFAGALACALVFLVSAPSASASSRELLQAGNPDNTTDKTVMALLRQPATTLSVVAALETEPAEETQPQPEPVKHQVAEHETLSSIAKLHETTWQRLFSKNMQLSDPNTIKPGDELVIPAADEQLEERALPAEPPAPRPAVSAGRTASATTRQPSGSSAGNGYTPGYCTWYVKNRRPELPNNLGNAYAWAANAAAMGMPTGSAPRVGAAGQRGNHVVYVESVNDDGTVTISEMNHKGLYVLTTRTLPADYFSYIY